MRPKPIDGPGWLERLRTAALVLLLAGVVGRATMHEYLRDPTPVNPGEPATPLAAGPATSLALDGLLMLPAGLLLLRGCFAAAGSLRFHVSHGLFVLWGGLAFASLGWADDQFAAAVNAAHLISAAAAMWAATQLFADATRLRLLAGTCVSLLLIFTAQGIIYRLVDVPENVRYWEEHRTDELARRGWQADSFQAEQFERKLRNGEMIGFSTSPNTFAAALVLVGVVTAGVVIQRLVDRDEPGWPLVVALPLLPAAWILTLTQSKAALTAPLIATAMLASIAWFGARLRHRAHWVYGGGMVVAAVFAATTIFFGITRGRLPTASLAFRWNYWLGGWRIFTQHPWLGVGWSSFSNRYLAVRLPVAAEEVKDPHNFIVRSFVELGIVGGILAVAWAGRLVWEMLSTGTDTPAATSFDRRQTAGIIASIGTVGFLIGVIGGVDLTSSGTNGWFILLQLLQRLLYFALMLLALSAATLRSSAQPVLDGRPAVWIARATAVAVGVFLIQNLIDFSFFEPGTTTLAAVVAGAATARFGRHDAGWSRRLAVPATLLTGAGTLAVLAGLWLPVTLAENHAAVGDDAVRAGDVYAGSERLTKAFHALWFSNADYAFRAALPLERSTGVSASLVLTPLRQAIDANPCDPQFYRNRAAYLLVQSSPDGQQIIADYAKALQLNPNEVAIHLEFADALLALRQTVRAREELTAALRYNDLLNPDEPKRLAPTKVEQIRRRIASL